MPAIVTAASLPPVIITSQCPKRIVFKASIIEFAEDAQAETVVQLGPMKPYFIDMFPGAISAIIFGMKNGLKRGVPSPAAKFNTSC